MNPLKVLYNTGIAIIFIVINFLTVKGQSTHERRVPPWFVERFKATAGAFFPVNNTDVQVGTKNGVAGTNIDFENDLGFRRNTGTFMADFQWRASRRSRFDFSYLRVARSVTKTLDKEIAFGDNTYQVNTTVDAFFNTNIYRFSYGYAFLLNPKFEAGLLVGAHIVGLNTGISVSGANIGASIRDNFGVTAPLPDIGLWGGYAFSPRWYVNAEFDYFALTINDYSGKIIAYNAAVHYLVVKHFDIALGYSGLNARVDADREHLVGYLKWGYNGPSVTASYSFGHKRW